MRILLVIMVPPILLFACAVILMHIALPAPFPPALSRGRNQMVAVITGLMGVGYIVGLVVTVLSSFLRPGRILDTAFSAAELTPEPYMIFGRQYHGTIEERQVKATYLPPQTIRSALLEITIQADLGTRMALGQQRPLLDCRECPPIISDQPGLSHLQILAENEHCANNLLTDTTGSTALARLLADQETLGSGEIYLQPEQIWFRYHQQRASEDQVQQWLEDLMVLANAAEKAFRSEGCRRE